MKILVWNCRGLRSSCVIQILWCLIKCHTPHLVFLMESKLSTSQFHLIPNLKFKGHSLLMLYIIEAVSFCFGHTFIDLCVISYFSHHIATEIFDNVKQIYWSFLDFYGELEIAQQWRSWSLLDYVGSRLSDNLLVAGDFNEILDMTKRLGDDQDHQIKWLSLWISFINSDSMTWALFATHSHGIEVVKIMVALRNDLIASWPLLDGDNHFQIPLLLISPLFYRTIPHSPWSKL